MTATLFVSEPTVLSPGCGCWPAYFTPIAGDADGAACNICGEEVTVSIDVERYLEEGERLVWTPSNDGEGHDRGLVLAYFTETIESDEE